MKTLPREWYVQITKENISIVKEWFKKTASNSTRFYSIGAYYGMKNGDGDAWSEDALPKRKIIITFEHFKKYVLKQETMKAQTFKINGRKGLLKAIWSELRDLGYNTEAEDVTFISICHNMSDKTRTSNFTKEDYIELYNGYNCKSDIVFELPQQYDEALAFAKEQLEDKYWVKTPEKWDVGTFVVFNIEYGGHPMGTISKITEKSGTCARVEAPFNNDKNNGCNLFFDVEGKWFATREEAEAFAETLKLKPVESRFSRTKKVEDLVYPDVVHCNSQEERDLLAKFWPNINPWNNRLPYLMAGNGSSGGNSDRPYEENGGGTKYVNYEFSNIIFPKEFVLPNKWFIKLDSINKLFIDSWRTCGPLVSTDGFIHSKAPNSSNVGYLSSSSALSGYDEITNDQFFKYVIKKPISTETKLPFGNLEFIINKEKQLANCKEGFISKQQIQEIVDWFDKDFKLLGHSMQIVNEGKWYLKFGCCKGTLAEAKAILKAFN